MDLYWKDTRIPAEASLRVVEAGGDGVPRLWKVLEIREKNNSDEYYDPLSKRTFPLRKVMKNRRLSAKSEAGDLLHIPPCSYFLVIEESSVSGGEPAKKRCFNVDFLSTLLDVKIL
jgi:hypothetical protein